MRPRRVVITGIGVVAPNGIGKDAFWDALVKGKSGIRKITLFDPEGLPTDIAGEVPSFDPCEFMPRSLAAQRGRASHLGVAAARLALLDAGLESAHGMGVYVGMTFPAMDYVNELVSRFSLRGSYVREELMLLYSSISPNIVSMDIANVCGTTGPRETVANACSSGSMAVRRAFEEIRFGRGEMHLAGGVDACLTYLGFAALIAGGFQVVSSLPPEEVSRPYDSNREGAVCSEGATILVLESLDHAVLRRARIYGEILAAEVYSYLPGSEPEAIRHGLAVSMSRCLAAAGLAPENVDYICAHGPSLPTVDVMETLAFKDTFGPVAYRIPISSIKSTLGNPMAASGPMQIAAALLSMRHSTIPPTANLHCPDPLCDLDYVPLKPRKGLINVAMVDSHGFDNVDATVLLSKGHGEWSC